MSVATILDIPGLTILNNLFNSIRLSKSALPVIYSIKMFSLGTPFLLTHLLHIRHPVY